MVWNRSRRARDELAAKGAKVANNAEEVFGLASTVVVMLADGEVLDEVLGRGGGRHERLVHDHTSYMGRRRPTRAPWQTTWQPPGGRYVEVPVSGSRKPAEAGRLVAMLAADDPSVLDRLEPLWEPMCPSTVRCGRVPAATLTKLAVNVFLIAMVTGLAEAFPFGRRHGLDVEVVRRVLDDGPMASDVSRLKAAMLAAGDVDAQAAVSDVHYNSRLVVEAAHASGTAVPLLEFLRGLVRRGGDARAG